MEHDVEPPARLDDEDLSPFVLTLRGVADLLPVAVVAGGPDGGAQFANRAWTEITGQHDLAFLGHGWLRILPVLQFASESAAIEAALAAGESRESAWRITRRDGVRRSLSVRVTPGRDQGRTVGFVATIADVTSAESDARLLVHQATHDPMTGLLNRGAVDELIQHALDRCRRAPATITALLFIDVDALKATNDRHGHLRGDQLLQVLAHRIRDAVRPVDVVARYGGDEFVVLCEDLSDPLEARLIAQRIIDATRASGSGSEVMSVSIGVAFAREPDEGPLALVDEADQAMYQAKLLGGGHHHVIHRHDDDAGEGDRLDDTRAPKERWRDAREPGERLVMVAEQELRSPLTIVSGLVTLLHHDRYRLSDADREAARQAIVRQTRRLNEVIDQMIERGV